MTIHAIFENGVFRPTQPVEMPERSRVILDARLEEPAADAERQDSAAIWAVLGHPVNTGDALLAERHDEHRS